MLKENREWIEFPNEDVLKNDTLLILIDDEQYNVSYDKADKIMKKYYPYPYVIVQMPANPLFIRKAQQAYFDGRYPYALIARKDMYTYYKDKADGERKKYSGMVFNYVLKDMKSADVYLGISRKFWEFDQFDRHETVALSKILREMRSHYDWEK